LLEKGKKKGNQEKTQTRAEQTQHI